MDRYTTVKVMKMNACRVTIRMWKIAQPIPRNAPKNVPTRPVAAHMPSNRKITSPAYILPNRRREWERGLETYSMTLKRKFGIQTSGLLPKGEQNSSCSQPPRPLTWIAKKIISSQTDRANAKVALTSDVGTLRQYSRPNTCL